MFEISNRFRVFSDLNANITALSTIMKASDKSKYLCLGNAIGYGADSKVCLEQLRKVNSMTYVKGIYEFEVHASSHEPIDQLSREIKQLIREQCSIVPTNEAANDDSLHWFVQNLPRHFLDDSKNIMASNGFSSLQEAFSFEPVKNLQNVVRIANAIGNMDGSKLCYCCDGKFPKIFFCGGYWAQGGFKVKFDQQGNIISVQDIKFVEDFEGNISETEIKTQEGLEEYRYIPDRAAFNIRPEEDEIYFLSPGASGCLIDNHLLRSLYPSHIQYLDVLVNQYGDCIVNFHTEEIDFNKTCQSIVSYHAGRSARDDVRSVLQRFSQTPDKYLR